MKTERINNYYNFLNDFKMSGTGLSPQKVAKANKVNNSACTIAKKMGYIKKINGKWTCTLDKVEPWHGRKLIEQTDQYAKDKWRESQNKKREQARITRQQPIYKNVLDKESEGRITPIEQSIEILRQSGEYEVYKIVKQRVL